MADERRRKGERTGREEKTIEKTKENQKSGLERKKETEVGRKGEGRGRKLRRERGEGERRGRGRKGRKKFLAV